MLKHGRVVSPIFERVKVLEFDVGFGPSEGTTPIRLELFRSTNEDGHFRARIWRLELFRMGIAFPYEVSGELWSESHEDVAVEYTLLTIGDGWWKFSAPSEQEALERVVEAFEKWLVHTFGSAESPP